MKKIILLFISALGSLFYDCRLNAQNYLSLEILFGKESFVIDSARYFPTPENQLGFQTLKFYIGGIEFYQEEKMVWKEKPGFYLVDASSKKSLNIAISKPKKLNFTKIKFNLGIDSLTNVRGVMAGDLDPTLGMYWTWQSGYINFKLEGTSSLSKHPKKEFQFHLGGYKAPYNTFKSIDVETSETEITVDIKKLINHLEFQKTDHLMLPGKEAQRLSECVKECFIKKAR